MCPSAPPAAQIVHKRKIAAIGSRGAATVERNRASENRMPLQRLCRSHRANSTAANRAIAVPHNDQTNSDHKNRVQAIASAGQLWESVQGKLVISNRGAIGVKIRPVAAKAESINGPQGSRPPVSS